MIAPDLIVAAELDAAGIGEVANLEAVCSDVTIVAYERPIRLRG